MSQSQSQNRFLQLIQQENIEDYSLRYAPRTFRRWSPLMVASAGLGASAALFPFAISAALSNQYGSVNALIGNLVSVLICVLTGIPIARAVAKHNIDMDLLTRGAGFGYMGSTLTSLIYAIFTFVYFAFEGAIMAQGVTGTYRFNPVGFAPMVIASVVSIAAYFGAFGDFLATYSTFLAALLALVLTPIVALATRGQFYISRTSAVSSGGDPARRHTCVACQGAFETPDMLDCPFHAGPICSLCCTVESKCGEICKVSETGAIPIATGA